MHTHMDEDLTREVLKQQALAEALKERVSSLDHELDSLKERVIELKSDSAEKQKLTSLESTYKRDKAVAIAVGGALAVFLTTFASIDLHNIARVVTDKEVKEARKEAKSAAKEATGAATDAQTSSGLANKAATQAEASAKKAADKAVAAAVKSANA